MPLDMSNPEGFTAFLFDVFDAFREVAIGVYEGDDPDDWTVPDNLLDADGDPVLNDVAVGPVVEDALASQHAYPLAWVVPQTYTPSYETSATDQGELQVQVVIFATDTDPWSALKKAATISGRIVNNVEADRALTTASIDNDAAATWLTNYQLDFQATPGNERAQLKFCQMLFGVNVERRYR